MIFKLLLGLLLIAIIELLASLARCLLCETPEQVIQQLSLLRNRLEADIVSAGTEQIKKGRYLSDSQIWLEFYILIQRYRKLGGNTADPQYAHEVDFMEDVIRDLIDNAEGNSEYLYKRCKDLIVENSPVGNKKPIIRNELDYKGNPKGF